MNIDEAVTALKKGETINCADTGRTCTMYTDEGVRKVKCVRKGEDGDPDDTNLMTLERYAGLYSRAVFGAGEFKLNKRATAPPAKGA